MKTVSAIAILCVSLGAAWGQEINPERNNETNLPNITGYFTNEDGTYGVTDKGDTLLIFKAVAKEATQMKSPSSLRAAGNSFIASACFFIGSIGLGVAGGVTGEPALYYAGAGSAGVGLICILIGGIQLRAASIEMRQDRIAKFSINPTGLSAHLTF